MEKFKNRNNFLVSVNHQKMKGALFNMHVLFPRLTATINYSVSVFFILNVKSSCYIGKTGSSEGKELSKLCEKWNKIIASITEQKNGIVI